MSERRAGPVTGQARATQRSVPRPSPDAPALIARIVARAPRCGRYGSRRITALLRQEGWRVNPKRVARRWRQEGLRVPGKPPQRGRLWLAAGSLVRRRAERPSHVWSSAFVFDRPAEGRPVRILALGDADHPRGPASRRRPPTAPRRRPGAVGPAVRRARAADVSAGRQRPGVHRHRGAGLAAPGRGHAPLHRTGQSLGERRWGIVQRHAARRVPQSRALRHPAGSPDPHRGLAAGVQPDPPPPCPRLPPPRPGNAATPGTSPDARPGDRTH